MPWSDNEQIININEVDYGKMLLPKREIRLFRTQNVQKKSVSNNGNFDCTVEDVEMSLVCPFFFPKRGCEEALQSNTLTQPARHIDCNINPARHTDGYVKGSTKVSLQIHRNRSGQRSRCCSTKVTGHFQSDPVPAAGWKELDKVAP